MTRDPIRSLLRIRRIAVSDAKRGVVRALSREDATEQLLRHASASVAHEFAVAQLSGGDAEVEAFAAWLPIGRQAVLEAEIQRDQAARETALARSALALSQAAYEATEALLERRAASERDRAERRTQAVLDEAGLRSAASIAQLTVPTDVVCSSVSEVEQVKDKA